MTRKPLIVVFIWALLLTGSFVAVDIYKSQPGTAAQNTAAAFPHQSKLPRSANAHTLVVFVHPQCPCTKASINEVVVAKSRAPELRTIFVFMQPPGHPANWSTESPRWKEAAAIPDATLVVDHEGREAALFGAQTSGQTFLYSPEGQLEFAGGVTASRGHEGDNAGVDSIVEFVSSGHSSFDRTSVFGCSLVDKLLN